MNDELAIPLGLVEARPDADVHSRVSAACVACFASDNGVGELHVHAGSLRYIDPEGESPRDVRVDAGHLVVIVPGVQHRGELSADAAFIVQFCRTTW